MIPSQQQQSPTLDDIKNLIDEANSQWVDQYNQHLLLTVQAVQRLHDAFNRKFPR